MSKPYEIQWVGIAKTKELETLFQKMAQLMAETHMEIMTFFGGYEESGYMLEAYDDFEWFEATARTRDLE